MAQTSSDIGATANAEWAAQQALAKKRQPMKR